MRKLLVKVAVVSLTAMFAPALPIAATAASAAGSAAPGYTLEGCQQDGPHAGHVSLPNGDGKFICPDNAYTTGNLSKGWNELDLVPHRVTLSSMSAGSYTLNLGGDHAGTADAYPPVNNMTFGWDVVSVPVLNTTLSYNSGASCPSVTADAQAFVLNTNGGAYDSVQRAVHFSAASDTTGDCVYDYYQRLALGAHNYPGSSLQSYVNSSWSGEKRISLPVREALPQTITKNMTATQDSDYDWSLTKAAVPTTLPLGNTCPSSSGASGAVQITVTWTKIGPTPSGAISVVTTVNAQNPAARSVTVTVDDNLYSGTTLLQSHTFGPTEVTSGGDIPLGTWTTTVPAGTTDLNDIATGHYTDTVTGVAIPQTTTATDSATVDSSGVTTHGSATITDTESITGSGLTFSVSTPSSGSFVSSDGVLPAYVAGTATTGPVAWSSGSVSSSGSVVFDKTVYAAQGTSTSSGSLSDTATLSSSPSLTRTASASTTITSSTLATLSLTKTIPNILQGSETADFTLQVASGTTFNAANIVASRTFHFTAGQTTSTLTVPDLPSGDYVVHEVPTTGWAPRADVPISLTGPMSATPNACGGAVTFNNSFAPPSVRAIKITVPAGHEAGWVMTLTKPDATTQVVTTDATGLADFGNQSLEGAYSIAETPQLGWDQTSAVGCSFTISLPADNDRTFTCTITNTQRGHIVVYKHTTPAGAPDLFTFTPSYNSGTTFQLSDGQSNDSGLLVPGSYSVSEGAVTGWYLDHATCTDGTTSYAPSAITLGAGKTVRCDFYNIKYGHVRVLKTVSGGPIPAGSSYTFQLRSGASASAAGTTLSTITLDSTHDPVQFPNDLVPGTYQVCELGVPVGGHSTIEDMTGFFVPPPGDNSTVCAPVTVPAGALVTVTVDNTPPPGGDARTIGYWRNWASCRTSNGKQAPVLDQTLALAQPTGVYVGILVLHGSTATPNSAPDCLKAVRILSKQRIDTGYNMARDPAFGLAAQYLAARLNYLAGAQTCSTATTAINQAQALLAAIHFNGITHDVMTSAQVSQARSLASTLDSYNNNTLSGC